VVRSQPPEPDTVIRWFVHSHQSLTLLSGGSFTATKAWHCYQVVHIHSHQSLTLLLRGPFTATKAWHCLSGGPFTATKAWHCCRVVCSQPPKPDTVIGWLRWTTVTVIVWVKWCREMALARGCSQEGQCSVEAGTQTWASVILWISFFPMYLVILGLLFQSPNDLSNVI